MKIKIYISSGGEYRDIDFEDMPIHIPLEVEVITKDGELRIR